MRMDATPHARRGSPRGTPCGRGRPEHTSVRDHAVASPDHLLTPVDKFAGVERLQPYLMRTPLRDDLPGLLGRLYDEHAAGLYRYALMMLADPAGAEDVVQEAFTSMLTLSGC